MSRPLVAIIGETLLEARCERARIQKAEPDRLFGCLVLEFDVFTAASRFRRGRSLALSDAIVSPAAEECRHLFDDALDAALKRGGAL